MCITVGETHGTASIYQSNKTPSLSAFGRKRGGFHFSLFHALPRASLPLARGYAHFTPCGVLWEFIYN
ncbi:MAG: hypothetical protein FWD49_06985 [Firmicutes bacterium]|nr:hypothetical protein [Bacillota bacterium]